MPDVTDTAARKGKPASEDPARRAAETIVYQSRFPPHAFKKEGDEHVERFTRIISAAFADALPDLIEPPKKLNWARQNYCSGWNQCVHAMRKRFGFDAARQGAGKEPQQ